MTPLQISRIVFFWSMTTLFFLLIIFQALLEISDTSRSQFTNIFNGARFYIFAFYFLFILSFELRENSHYVDSGRYATMKAFRAWGSIFIRTGINSGILEIIFDKTYFSSSKYWRENNLHIMFINFLILTTFIVVFGSLLIFRDDFGQRVYSLSLKNGSHNSHSFWIVWGANFISWVPFLLMHTVIINFRLYLVFFMSIHLLSYGYVIFDLNRICSHETSTRHSLPLFIKISYGLLMVPSLFGLFVDILLGSMGLILTALFFRMMSILYASRKLMVPPINIKQFAFQSHIL